MALNLSAARALPTLLCAFLIANAAAQGVPSARITRVIKDVKIIQGQATRDAALNNAVPQGAVIRTAAASRAEIVVRDRIVLRLASNTFLSLGPDGPALNQGAVLFEAPSGVMNAKIAVGEITIDTAGTTGIIERFGGTYVKIIMLQGKARVFLAGTIGESLLVDAGQILIAKPNPKFLPEAVDFDIDQLYRTSMLTNADFRPLASRPLINRAIAEQKKNPELNATNLVIFGRGTLVTLIDPTPSPVPKAAPSPTATASPKPQASPRPRR